MKTKTLNTLLGIGTGVAIGASAIAGNGASTAPSAPAQKIIKVDDRLSFQKIDLYILENANLSAKGDKKKKKGDQKEGGKPNMNSGPGMNKEAPWRTFGFEYKDKQYAFDLTPEGMTVLNQTDGVFHVSDKYVTSKTSVTIKVVDSTKVDGKIVEKAVDKTFEMTLSVKKNGFIVLLVPQEKDARNAIVFYSGVELYKDKSGAYALSVGGDGLTFMDKNGNVSAYQFKPNVESFHCVAIKANTSITDRKLDRKNPVVPDNVLLTSKDGMIKVDGIFKGKRGYTVSDTLGLLAEQKIDSAAMTCVNPEGKYNKDEIHRSVAVNTDKFYVSQIHYKFPDAMMKAFGYTLFDGNETIMPVATKDTLDPAYGVLRGKTDLSAIIGSKQLKGMVYIWAQLDSKKGMDYQVTAGNVVAGPGKPLAGSLAYGNRHIVYVLAVENNEMVAKLLYTDHIGKPKKLQVVNTNIPVGTPVKGFTVTADANGITAIVTTGEGAKAAKTVLKINNEFGPNKVGEEDKYFKQSFPDNETGMLDLSKPMIDFTQTVRQQEKLAQRNLERRANNAFRNYRI
ncbi:MAG: hypothetical protein WC861_04475 [Candidatus Micrarchaeia archaeon]|jgi:hypothetical protein